MMAIVETLLTSNEPSLRFKARVNALGENIESPDILQLREEIRRSPRSQTLLSERDGLSAVQHNVYRKYFGAHWILVSLADIGYPPGDALLVPLAELVYRHWLNPSHTETVPIIQGRARRCASQEGNALFALLTLGLADERVDQLAQNLIRWQWPDGGWNCDRRPEATNSSFWETLIPLRGLSLYARMTGDKAALEASARAAEVFLKRRLFRRERDGGIINEQFTMLHYPCYWHYDILAGLKVIVEAGFISDPRCLESIVLLESKRLHDGGWAAEEKFYRVSKPLTGGCDLVRWGVVSKTRMNEWVTADALYVLSAAGKLV